MNLFIGEVKKVWIGSKRYWFSSITDLVFYYILFMIVFYYTKNLRSIDPNTFGIEISKLIVGYISWFFFSLTLSFISNGLYSEMVTGTFEQLCLTGTSIQGIMFTKFLVYSIKNILIMVPFTILLVVSTKIRLHLNIQMLWIFLIIIIGILGLSYLLGGLTIRFKNTGQLSFIISSIFLGTSLINLNYSHPIMERIGYLIPFIRGQDLLKELTVDSFIVTMDMYIILILNAVVYLALGLTIFKVLFNRTRAKGMLIRY